MRAFKCCAPDGRGWHDVINIVYVNFMMSMSSVFLNTVQLLVQYTIEFVLWANNESLLFHNKHAYSDFKLRFTGLCRDFSPG